MLGTLNSRMPSCSEAVYKSRILGEVASSNTQKQVGYNLSSVAWLTLVTK